MMPIGGGKYVPRWLGGPFGYDNEGGKVQRLRQLVLRQGTGLPKIWYRLGIDVRRLREGEAQRGKAVGQAFLSRVSLELVLFPKRELRKPEKKMRLAGVPDDSSRESVTE